MIQFGIRKKITYGFYLLLTIMVGATILTYGIINQIEEKVVFVEIIEDFFNATLEVRRFEKNYFLYRQEKDFDENQLYWRKLKGLFDNKNVVLGEIVSPVDLARLDGTIDDYQRLMRQLHDCVQGMQYAAPFSPEREAIGQRQARLEAQVRETGHHLTAFAEKTRLAEKEEIKEKLKTTREVLVVTCLSLFISVMFIAAIIGRKVVSSLKILESHTKIISQGDFVEIAIHDGEHEIRSLLTAFNRMSKELQTRQQQLVQSEKLAALGTLLSGVAHELNNPLSNISTSAQILDEEIEEGDLGFKKSLISQIESQSDKARDIVRTLLEFSRIREFSKQKLRLRKLIDDTIPLIRGQLPSEVEIAIDIPDDIDIFADKQRIQQVFLNLIKNGVDAIGSQGHIWVTARATERGECMGEVEIMIEDDGPGIDPDEVKKIFDPFFTTKDVGKGSGLGLFVVHDIVDWHGGTINVDSRPNVGTTFTIWLPGECEDNAT